MLFTLLVWLIITVIIYTFGLLILRLWSRWLQHDVGLNHFDPPTIAIIGFMALTVLLLYLSIILPIAGSVRMIILGICVTYWLYDSHFIYLHGKQVAEYLCAKQWWLHLVVIAILIIAAFQSSIGPDHPDAGLYYGQTVRWEQIYPTVLGLGNLSGRLAFNSSWLLPPALVEIELNGNEIFHSLNGLFLILFIIYCLYAIDDLLYKKTSYAALAAGLFLVLTPWFGFFHPYDISSPSQDLPQAILLFLVIIALLKLPEDSSEQRSYHLLYLAMLIAFAITVKLTNASLIFLFIWLIITEWRNNRYHTMLFILLHSVILLPWLIRNIILSGYLIYPFPTLDLFNVDWKIPIAEVQNMKLLIKTWALAPNQPMTELVGLTRWEWFVAVIQKIYNHPYLVYLLYPSVGVVIWSFKSTKIFFRQYISIIILLVITTGLWLFSAPDLSRFGFGIVASWAVILCLSFIQQLWLKIKSLFWHTVLISTVLISWLAWIISGHISYTELSNATLLFNTPYPQEGMIIQQYDGFSAGVSQSCWLATFPCVAGDQMLTIELRGKDLKDGFRIRDYSQ
ncbi:MAG: hypothetical protein WCV88_02235 [Patescibacteria group bacterium]|jgi:hypothetical protein